MEEIATLEAKLSDYFRERELQRNSNADQRKLRLINLFVNNFLLILMFSATGFVLQ